MQLNKLIIHEIIKETGENQSQIRLSSELIPTNQEGPTLISTLLRSYNSERILYAIFASSEGHYFPERLSVYRQSNRTNEDFISFTRAVLQNLNTSIQTINLAKGGYFVFAEYVLNGIDFISVFLIRDTEGKLLRRTEHSYSIQTIEYLDTNNLAMACRINETKLDSEESNYLTFTQKKQQDVADYFLNWIAVEQTESSIEYTKALYEIINLIEPPEDEETNQPYPIEVFRDKVYNYITSNPNQTINLQELSQHFYNDANRISTFAENQNISIDTEFRYNKKQLRKFISVSVNKDGINLKFSRGALNDKVKFSPENANIVIIESQKFATALRSELDLINNND
jgi:nucleoid-associated protein